MNCGLSLYVAEHLIRSNLLSADRNQRFIDLPPRIYTPLGRLEDVVMNNDENTYLVLENICYHIASPMCPATLSKVHRSKR